MISNRIVPLRLACCVFACVIAALLSGSVRATTTAGVAFTATATYNDLECQPLDDELQNVIQSMNDLGYGVTRGSLEASESSAHKQFRNPNEDLFLGHFDDSTDPDQTGIRFGGGDAIVFRTCTPSANHYFAFTPYLMDTVTSATGSPTTPSNASLGDSLNPLTVTGTGGTVYNEKITIVVTADQTTFDDIRNTFVQLGMGNEPIELLPIAPSKFLFSLDSSVVPRSELGLAERVSRLKSYALRARSNEPRPFYVFRQNATAPRDPIQVALRDTSVTGSLSTQISQSTVKFLENHAINTLVNSVTAHVEQDGASLVSATEFSANNGVADGVYAAIFEHGFTCIDDGLDCGLDNRDTLYTWDQSAHDLTSQDLYVLVGLNYSKLADAGGPQAVLNSFGVYRPAGGEFVPLNILKNYDYPALDPSLLPTTLLPGVRQFLLDNAVVLQVASAQCGAVSGLDQSMCFARNPKGPLVFMTKATLNPQTATGPDPNNVTYWRLLHFTR